MDNKQFITKLTEAGNKIQLQTYDPGIERTPTPSAPISVQSVQLPATTTITQMQRFDSGAVRGTDLQLRYDLISPFALERLAETCAEGAAKYGDDNWRKGIPNQDLLNHAINHLLKWQIGDTTEDHLAHAFWNIHSMMDNEANRPHMVVKRFASNPQPTNAPPTTGT